MFREAEEAYFTLNNPGFIIFEKIIRTLYIVNKNTKICISEGKFTV